MVGTNATRLPAASTHASQGHPAECLAFPPDTRSAPPGGGRQQTVGELPPRGRSAAEGRDIHRQTDAHEEARKRLGQVLAVGRQQAAPQTGL